MSLKRPTGDTLRLATKLAAPVAQELVKTVLLLSLMFLGVWGLLETFQGGEGSWLDRLWGTLQGASRDRNGLAIAARFFPAAGQSLAIVLLAAGLLAAAALPLAALFALVPPAGALRLPMSLFGAIPSFMYPFLIFPDESSYWWPAVCLALGDLNLAAVTAHCYEEIRGELNQPYVRTARAQGVSLWSDLWPRASLFTLEAIRARVPHLLGGTVAVEFAYNLHGVGTMALDAVVAQRPDTNVLVWIAGLGIVATRSLSLIHRLARAVLTPERSSAAQWNKQTWRVSIQSLFRSSGGPKKRPEEKPGLAASAGFSGKAEFSESLRAPGYWASTLERARSFWKLSASNRVKVSLATLTMILCAGLAATVGWGGGYSMLETTDPLAPPGLSHPLGTNALGEDMLSAVALGGRQLFLPLVAAVGLAVLLGGLLGTASGLWSGSVADVLLDLWAEVLESIPKLILVLAVITYISFNAYALKIYLVIGLAFAPLVYRAVRDEVAALRSSMFLEALVTLGVPGHRILGHNVLRNHVLPVLSLHGATMVGYVLLFDAILGFIGVRQYGEILTWGSLLGSGLEDLQQYQGAGIYANPYIVWGPLAAILLAIAGSVVLGDILKSLSRGLRLNR